MTAARGTVRLRSGRDVIVEMDVDTPEYPTGPVIIMPIGRRGDEIAYVEPENLAERAARLLRETADALDSVPIRMRVKKQLLAFDVTPLGLRQTADTIERNLADARALLASLGEIEQP